MPAATNIESIFNNLNSYHGQLTSLSQALNALRDVSEHIVAALEQDRAAMAGYIAAVNESQQSQGDAENRVADTAAATDTNIDLAAEAHEAPLAALLAEPIAQDASAFDTMTGEPAVIETAPLLKAVIEPVAPVAEAAAPAAQETAQPLPAYTPALLETTADTPVVAAETEQPIAPAPSAEQADTSAVDAAIAPVAGKIGDGKIVDLGSHRKAREASPARWRAKALVASLAITATATLGMHELMQTDLGQRLIELATCDGDMLSANRDCALLAWLML